MTIARLTFDLKDFSDYVDLSRFQFLYVAVNLSIIAIATSKYLILANGVSDDNNAYSDIRSVLEFREHCGISTCVLWLTDDVLCVGFETGYILCFSAAGEELFEYRGSKSCVQSLKIFSSINGKGPGLWILYEVGILVYIPIGQVLKGRSDSFLALKFPNHIGVNDFAFCPYVYCSSLFDLDEKDSSSHNIVVGGYSCAMSLYSIGNKILTQDTDKTANNKNNSMFSRTFSSIFSMASSSSSDGKKTDKGEEYLKVTEKCVEVKAVLDFVDTKRRILRLSIEPYGSLIAAADSLGRVTLYESSTNSIVRVWKGQRDARLSWTHSFREITSDVTRDNAVLHLVAYAPQLGLVSIYRMTLGVCVRIVPVGLNAQLLMTVEMLHGINNNNSSSTNSSNPNDFKIAKSYVLRSLTDTGVVEMTEMNPIDYADTDIDIQSALLLQSMDEFDEYEFGDTDEGPVATSDKKLIESRTLQKIKSNLSKLSEMYSNLSKASIAARAQNIDISSRFDENLTAGVETFILDHLTGDIPQCSLKGLISVMQWIESIELCGNLTYNQTHTDKVRDDCPCLCFSVLFHKKLLSLLSELLCFDETGEVESIKDALAEEVKVRTKLLSAYELLLDIKGQASSAVPTPTNVSSQSSPMKDFSSVGATAAAISQQSVVEEAAVICRSNSSRAEALCWALRAGKKQQNRNKAKLKSTQRLLTSKSLRSPLTPPPGNKSNSRTPDHSNSHSPVPVTASTPSSIIVTPVHDTRNESTSTKSGAIDSISTPHNLQQSIEGLFSEKIKQDSTIVNFTIFRLSLCENGKILPYEEDGSLVHNINTSTVGNVTDSEMILSVPSVFFRAYLENVHKTPFVASGHVIIRRVNWSPSVKMSRSVLALTVSPLFGDMFSMHSYSIAAKQMGAGGPIGLKVLMPLFLSFVVQQPVSQIVTNLLTKKLSASTFQRWLRDTLLTFQDLVTSSAAAVHAKITFDRENEDEFNNDDSGGSKGVDTKHQDRGEVDDEDEVGSMSRASSRGSSFSEETDYLTKLTRDIVESRRNSSAEQHTSQSQQDLWVVPSYDEFVRHLLRPAWCCARNSSNLEASLSFAAIVVETLLTVHEQVERRTYGVCNLLMTMKAWENLIRQLRVSLLLSSRIGLIDNETTITVEKLSNGKVSLHKLLAADTLSFALKADQAIDHEERCQEVFNRRTAAVNSLNSESIGSGGGGGGDQGRSDVLLAWGKVADKRWRNLIEVAIAEDTLEFELQQGVDGSKQGELEDSEESSIGGNGVGVHRKKPPVKRRRPLLLYFPKYSQQRYLGAYRAYILAERWSHNLSHVYELSSASEHLFNLPVNWRGAVAADIYKSLILPAMKLFVLLEDDAETSQQESKQMTAMSQQLLVIIADLNLLKTFIRSAVEILKFIENAIVNGKQLDTLGATETVDVNNADLTIDRCYEDEEVDSIWPPTTDRRLCQVYSTFYDRENRVCSEWTEGMVKSHISILWVMQLRFQCGLRGIKPVKVLGNVVLSSIELQNEGKSVSTKEFEASDELISIRVEFLKQCLRRLISVDPPVNVYKLAELWSMDLNRVRLLHITALLERGNMDDEVDLLVPQVTDKAAVVDSLTEILRGRLGGIVARIDRLSIFGPLIASMDTEAITWARKSIPAEYSPEPSVLEDIAKGRVKAVNINLISTRHLVMSMQSILLAVPVVDRYTASPTPTTATTVCGDGGGSLASSWLERKSKCDALLSLCNSFSQLSNSSRSNNK